MKYISQKLLYPSYLAHSLQEDTQHCQNWKDWSYLVTVIRFTAGICRCYNFTGISDKDTSFGPPIGSSVVIQLLVIIKCPLAHILATMSAVETTTCLLYRLNTSHLAVLWSWQFFNDSLYNVLPEGHRVLPVGHEKSIHSSISQPFRRTVP